jgi:hypothetical protein
MQPPNQETERPRRDENLESLRKLWLEALVDGSPGIRPQEVFLRLERKYQAAANRS